MCESLSACKKEENCRKKAPNFDKWLITLTGPFIKF